MMQKFLIVYCSKTGNTEKVAQALAQAAPERCDCCRVSEVGALKNYDVIFAGYWVDRGAPMKEMQDFLQQLHAKKVVLFQTLGAEPYSEHGVTSLVNAGKYLNPDCNVLGTLSIRGAIDPKLIAQMEKFPPGTPHAPTEESRKRWAEAAVHPNEEDLVNCKEYMLKFIAFYDRFYRSVE
jgi:flavodoxin